MTQYIPPPPPLPPSQLMALTIRAGERCVRPLSRGGRQVRGPLGAHQGHTAGRQQAGKRTHGQKQMSALHIWNHGLSTLQAGEMPTKRRPGRPSPLLQLGGGGASGPNREENGPAPPLPCPPSEAALGPCPESQAGRCGQVALSPAACCGPLWGCLHAQTLAVCCGDGNQLVSYSPGGVWPG